jgi:hypothetical protein
VCVQPPLVRPDVLTALEVLTDRQIFGPLCFESI